MVKLSTGGSGEQDDGDGGRKRRERPAAANPAGLDECRRCELWKHATQAVGGAGPLGARIMLVGEQPGDQEDRAGTPFVGPAGLVLDRALAAAGLDRRAVYITNAVKHFKWELRGKRCMHKTPAQREIEACYYWLEKELARIAPAVVARRRSRRSSAAAARRWTPRWARRSSTKGVGSWRPIILRMCCGCRSRR